MENSKINGGGGGATAAARGSRDPFVDVLRVFAIALIVLQHWLMPVVDTDDAGNLVTDNALATPGMWAVTWLSQVMPLVFFAGGAAAAYSIGTRLRRTNPASRAQVARTWVSTRVTRLAMPVIPLAVVWVPLPHLLGALGVPSDAVATGAHLVGALLWFLALYVVVVAATPLLLKWHERWRGREIALLAVAAVAVDVARFSSGIEAVGYANLAFVWMTVYLVGVVYAHGGLDRWTGSRGWWLVLGGFGLSAVTVAAGPYAPSMIGMPGAPLSNMNPPTAVLLSLAAGQLGLALVLRDRIAAWARLPEVSRLIAAVSTRMMTIYVWHTPALVAVMGVAVLGFGWATPTPFGADWRSAMPIVVAVLAAVLALFVRAFGRYETPRHTTRRASAPSTGVTLGSVVLVGAGLLTLTVGGFVPPDDGLGIPFAASLAVTVGTALPLIRQVTGSNLLTARERLIP